MTMPDPAAAPLIIRAKQFAALSGPFDPMAALRAAGAEDPAMATLVASGLAGSCDTDLDAGKRWLLRSGERRYFLDIALADPTTLAAAIAERRAQAAAGLGADTASTDLLAALAGDGDFAEAAIAATLAAENPERTLVERIVAALDRAGRPAPAQGQLTAARQALARIDRHARRAALESRGFFGRSVETGNLLAWLGKPVTAPPVQAAYIAGNPGIGKSALLEAVTGRAGDLNDALVIRLDFDRAGLDVNDLLGLTLEIARQIGDRLGDAGAALFAARLQAASVTRGEEGYGNSSRGSVPPELAVAIGSAVQAAGRPVLLILDTIEVLRARGEEHPERLFLWLDGLVNSGLQPLSVIAAGRGDALGSAPGRVGLDVPLAGLDAPAADALLDRLDVAPASRAAVATIAAGNPLLLRLAAAVVKESGTDDLPDGALPQPVAAAFLYRILLSRIDDPDLQRLAHPGLIARRISAAFLAQALAPALKMPPLSPERADALFNALAGQHWLVERDPVVRDYVIHRSDMRTILLPLLYMNEPALCAAVDKAAAAWFDRQGDAAAKVDAAYHRLQLLRVRAAEPVISPAVAQRFDEAMLAELPPQARDIVARAAGGRSSRLRKGAGAPPKVDEAALAAEVLNLIDREDWAEGQFVVDQMVAGGGIDARSPAAMAIRAFYWRSGRWDRARKLFAERDSLVDDDSEVFRMPLQLAISRLEIRSEFTRPRLVKMLALPEIDALIADAMRNAGPLARQGALAFVLAANGRRQAPLWSAKDGDAVAAALDTWIESDRDGYSDGTPARRGAAPATAHAFGVVRERLGARGLVSAAGIEWGDLQLLAALSPYPIIAANLAVLHDNDGLITSARAADARLSQAGGLFSGTPIGIGPVASNPIAGIAGLGLFAEWAGAEAFLRPDPDLKTLAEAAERWRRTVAGHWSYGAPPPGWAGGDSPDIIIRRRVQKLLDFDDPADWALRQLALWADDGEGAALLARLRKRHAGVLTAAAALPDAMARAALLLERNLPSAFVPPLTILGALS